MTPYDLYVSPTPGLAWWWLTQHVPGAKGLALDSEASNAWAGDAAKAPRGPIRRVLVVVTASSLAMALTRARTWDLLLRATFSSRVPAVLIVVGRARANHTAAAQRIIDGLTHDDGLRSPGIQITLRRELTWVRDLEAP
jgi:hypothetical protein